MQRACEGFQKKVQARDNHMTVFLLQMSIYFKWLNKTRFVNFCGNRFENRLAIFYLFVSIWFCAFVAESTDFAASFTLIKVHFVDVFYVGDLGCLNFVVGVFVRTKRDDFSIVALILAFNVFVYKLSLLFQNLFTTLVL